jgi:hypothetical protein
VSLHGALKCQAAKVKELTSRCLILSIVLKIKTRREIDMLAMGSEFDKLVGIAESYRNLFFKRFLKKIESIFKNMLKQNITLK